MTIPLPYISEQSTQDAWSYRATLQINQDTIRVDALETRIANVKTAATDLGVLTDPEAEQLRQLIINL